MARSKNIKKTKNKNSKNLSSRKNSRQNYSQEWLLEAVNKVRNGEMSFRQAEAAYEVPKSTIADHLKGFSKTNKLGRPALLTNDVEIGLVHAINKMADWGFWNSDGELKIIIHDYLISTNQKIFKNNYPGKTFFKLFKQRHHNILSSRIAQNLPLNRAVALNSLNLDEFFQTCRKYYDYLEMHDKPQNVYNVDEISLSDSQGSARILCKKGMKNPARICGNNEKIMLTVTFCCYAAGKYLPPYVVYKSQSMWDLWTQNGPEDCQYTCTSSGWVEAESFVNWFKFFIKCTDSNGKKHNKNELILTIFLFFLRR